MSKVILLITTLALLCAPLVPAAAADKNRTPEEPELRRELVHLQHIRPHDAERVLRAFCSKYGDLDSNESLGTLTIVDQPALVGKMLEVLAEIDLPRAAWSFQILLIAAQDDPEQPDDFAALERLPDVADELKALFQYNVWEELDTAVIKTTDGTEAELRVSGEKGFYVRIEPHARGNESVDVAFHLYRPRTIVNDGNTQVLFDTVVETTFETRPGDTTVVGASKLNGDDRALITIVQTRAVDR
ncbi:MAG: hypothetical protein QGH45_18075 [Myxococcota bacterium]|nr:hypothetical protein [Myxococcota bacterium]